MKKSISGLTIGALFGAIALFGISGSATGADNVGINLSGLNKRITDLEESNRSLVSRLGAQNERINSLNNIINSQRSQLGALDGRLSTLSNQLNSRFGTLATNVGRLTSSVNSLTPQVLSLGSAFKSMAKQITDITGTLKTIGVTTDTAARLTALEKFMKVADPKLESIAADIQNLISRVKTLESVGGSSGTTVNYAAQISDLNTRLTALNTAFTKMSNDLKDLTKVPAIAQIITSMTAMGTRLKEIDAELVKIHQALSAMKK
jgi:chromosome segregation ATPase